MTWNCKVRWPFMDGSRKNCSRFIYVGFTGWKTIMNHLNHHQSWFHNLSRHRCPVCSNFSRHQNGYVAKLTVKLTRNRSNHTGSIHQLRETPGKCTEVSMVGKGWGVRLTGSRDWRICWIKWGRLILSQGWLIRKIVLEGRIMAVGLGIRLRMSRISLSTDTILINHRCSRQNEATSCHFALMVIISKPSESR